MLEKSILNHYREQFGSDPEIIVRAPGRINLIGEHTDYNGGLVLPAAIDKAIWLAMGKRSDNLLKFSAYDLQDEFQGHVITLKKSEKGWPNYLLGVISELQKDGVEIEGVNVAFGGDIPIGAGLSSSAALESGMLSGLNQLFDLELKKMDIVKLAQRGENRFVGMNCGIMDMFASVMGRAESVVRIDCRSLEYEHFPFHTPDYTIVLCDSGVKHALVDSEYNTRRRECEEGVHLLQAVLPGIQTLRDVPLAALLENQARLPPVVFQRCKYVVEEIARVFAACDALKNNDLKELGDLMNQTSEGLRHGYEVTCAETDFLVDKATEQAAVIGARQVGGGFGGCTLNLVKASESNRFIENMQAEYQQRFGRSLVCHVVKLADGVEIMAA
ncbi:MAG: galactokinase [Saprospiraceae bacterium]|nr:galactokinase [Saprospiraceae bacterium]